MALLLVSFVIYYAYRKSKKQHSYSSSIPLSSKIDQGRFCDDQMYTKRDLYVLWWSVFK